jgi:hypothetical protein
MFACHCVPTPWRSMARGSGEGDDARARQAIAEGHTVAVVSHAIAGWRPKHAIG